MQYPRNRIMDNRKLSRQKPVYPEIQVETDQEPPIQQHSNCFSNVPKILKQRKQKNCVFLGTRPSLNTIFKKLYTEVMYIWSSLKNPLAQIKRNNSKCTTDNDDLKVLLKSRIRQIAWHPHMLHIAIIGIDDVISIYINDNLSKSKNISTAPQPFSEPTTLLINEQQKVATCLAWRPYCFGDLAVGCEAGVCLWIRTKDWNNCQGNRVRNFRGMHDMHLLTARDHTNITSLEWIHNGNLLVTAALSEWHIIVWNIDCSIVQKLYNYSAPIYTLKWSTNYQYLFGGGINENIVMWNATKEWCATSWKLVSRVQTMAWSSCGRYLFCVLPHDTRLICMSLDEEMQIFVCSNSKVKFNFEYIADLLDLQQITNAELESYDCFPSLIVTDEHSRYLAVMYNEKPFVSVFVINAHPQTKVSVSPFQIIKSTGAQETATTISFESKWCNQKESTMLAVAWSTGRVEFTNLLLLQEHYNNKMRNIHCSENINETEKYVSVWDEIFF